MKQISKITLFTTVLYFLNTSFAFAASCEVKMFGTCDAAESCLACWLRHIFQWAQGAILVAATVVIMFAGVIYMTSSGNPDRIKTSKKLIMGALTGVAVIVLGRFFLKYVIGVPWLGNY
jgi:hypothetical protein